MKAIKPRSRRTIIAEATAVILICVVLVLILNPVMPHRPRRAPSCMSNVKQMGRGLLIYAMDYEERLPRAATWMDATLPYTKNKSVYRCPDTQSSRPADFGYAFNASLELTNRESYPTPGKVVWLYDSNDLHWNARAPGRAGAANPPRHFGRDVFGFLDGHATAQKLKDE